MTVGMVTTTSLAATDYVQVDNGGPLNVQMLASLFSSFQNSHTTSALVNSGSITLSSVFTALTFTQTSTGNTVYLKTSPKDGEFQGFSITNNVTNLTVSSAANTVLNGAATDTTSAGGSFWWQFNSSNTTWYKFNGGRLSA